MKLVKEQDYINCYLFPKAKIMIFIWVILNPRSLLTRAVNNDSS